MKSFSSLAFPVDRVLTLPALPVRFLQCSWTVGSGEICSGKDISKIQNGAPLPFAVSPTILAEIVAAKYLTKGEDVKVVLEIQMNIKDLNVNYLPGDTVGILPKNPGSEVDYLVQLLGLADKQSEPLETVEKSNTAKKKTTVPNYVPQRSTVREILESCIDIRAIPKKLFLRALCEFTTEPQEKRRLEEFCSREGSTEYSKHILEARRTLLDVLCCFSSCKPPFSLLLEHLPRLQPRPYSIASTPLESQDQIRIVLSVIEGPESRKGICSNWLHAICRPFLDLSAHLEKLKISQESTIVQVPLYLRKSTDFRIPEDISVPLVMIGPGTGVAPFIGFLRHRQLQRVQLEVRQEDNWLFFGCRYKEKDFLFKDELNTFAKDNTLSRLVLSFSRDADESNSHPKYVQDNVRKYRLETVQKLLESDSHFFFCGDAKNMVKDVEGTIVQCIADTKSISKSEAEELYESVVRKGRIHKDVWL